MIHGAVEVLVDQKPADNPFPAAAALRPSLPHDWLDAPLQSGEANAQRARPSTAMGVRELEARWRLTEERPHAAL